MEGRETHFDPKLFDLFLQLKDEITQISRNFDDPLCRELNELSIDQR